MVVLGLSPLDKDATAAIYVDGEWHAVAEERLSRVRLQSGFPKRALRLLLRETGLEARDVDHVVYPFMPWWLEGRMIVEGFSRDVPATARNGTPVGSKLRHLRTYAAWCGRAIRDHRGYHRELLGELRALGLDRRLTRIEHHAAHAASAYLTSGFEEAVALTLDWYGGGLAGSVSRCTPAGIERLHEFRYPHSLGLFFAQVTAALGFTSSLHEGKIVGLAAYGDAGVVKSLLGSRLVCEGGDLRYRSAMDPELARNLARSFPREHVAAAYQSELEDVTSALVAHWVRTTGLEDVVLAGGVAANVKMNQRIAALDEVRRIFVHPNMGDGGAGVGAILAFLFERDEAQPGAWESCYLGPAFDDAEVTAAVRGAGLEPSRVENVAKRVAELLRDGRVVARFSGRMEYGPRALGNRSILCAATDASINSRLNDLLGRTDFMPFAPVTLAEHCGDRYRGIDKALAAARFMTITCECTAPMKRESPAAVHVDGTARPQCLRRQDNPDFYAIVEAYYELTGIPTVINTSFNMHEEPIVCGPDDAVRAFVAAGLDYLSIGPFLVESPVKR
jgi:carbamoyltransferase